MTDAGVCFFNNWRRKNLMRIRCSLVVLMAFAGWSFAKESTDKPYAGSTQPPLSPAEAQKKFVVPQGFEVRLFAAIEQLKSQHAVKPDGAAHVMRGEGYGADAVDHERTAARACVEI